MTYEEIAQALLKRYPALDPKRTERALALVTSPHQRVKRAAIDENGHRISPTAALWVVRSSAKPPYKKHEKIWYLVAPHQKKCQCVDSRRGNICKHRIAVYLIMEKQGLNNIPAEPIRQREVLAELGY